MHTWISTMVRRAYLRRVIVWATLLAGAVAAIVPQQRFISNFVNGPFTLGADDLAQIKDVNTTPKYFVRVAGSRVIDTGVNRVIVKEENGVESRETTSARYYAIAMGDRLLLAESSEGPSTSMEGALRPIPPELAATLFTSADMQALHPRFYPFQIRDESFRVDGYGEIVLAVIFVFLLLRKGIPAWRIMNDPSSHPAVRRAASWGDATGVAVAAEREHGSPRFTGRGWRVGDNYLIWSPFFSFDILRFADLLWAYKRVTKQKVNFVPVGKTYAALLACYSGTAVVSGSEQKTEELLAFAAERAPWAISGYSEDLANAFKNNTDDFCSTVEQRREQLRSGIASGV